MENLCIDNASICLYDENSQNKKMNTFTQYNAGKV